MNIQVDPNVPIVTLARLAHRLGCDLDQDGHGGLKVVPRCRHANTEWSDNVLRCKDCGKPVYFGLSHKVQAQREIAELIERT